MTKQVIYHDFRRSTSPALEPESTVILTASLLTKGRRWFKAWESLNAAIYGACLVLCGACIGVSLLTILLLRA